MYKPLFLKDFGKIAAFVLFFTTATVFELFSQQKSRSKTIYAGLNIPFGTFHSTHDIGFGIQGEFTDIRFRKSKKKKERALRSVFLSGLELFSGQKENVRGYPFRYLALWIFHASGGAVYALNKKWRISATAGPSLGNYSNTFRFNWSGAVSGSYAVTNRLSAVAGLILFKEPGADVLASFSLRTGYRF